MLHRRPNISQLGSSRLPDEVGGQVTIGSPLAYLHDQVDEGASLFMQTTDGTLKAVKLRTRQGASAVKSSEHRQPYSEALAKYILEQERKGNKFFIQTPRGAIRRFSVVRNPVDYLPSRHAVIPKHA